MGQPAHPLQCASFPSQLAGKKATSRAMGLRMLRGESGFNSQLSSGDLCPYTPHHGKSPITSSLRAPAACRLRLCFGSWPIDFFGLPRQSQDHSCRFRLRKVASVPRNQERDINSSNPSGYWHVYISASENGDAHQVLHPPRARSCSRFLLSVYRLGKSFPVVGSIANKELASR